MSLSPLPFCGAHIRPEVLALLRSIEAAGPPSHRYGYYHPQGLLELLPLPDPDGGEP